MRNRLQQPQLPKQGLKSNIPDFIVNQYTHSIPTNQHICNLNQIHRNIYQNQLHPNYLKVANLYDLYKDMYKEIQFQVHQD